MAAENLSLKLQLEASGRRGDQLQAALMSMENDVTAATEREQDLQRQVRYSVVHVYSDVQLLSIKALL